MREYDVVLSHRAFEEGADFDDISGADAWHPETVPKKPVDVEKAVLIRAAAGVRGVHGSVMATQFQAYVDQYRELPESDRPQPPASWLAVKVPGHRGYNAVKKDPALVWAAYRCQSDPDGLQGDSNYASIDLETSGPDGPGAFNPALGAIIEVGIVVFDQHENEVERYETLVRPNARVGGLYGTGAVSVHGITMADVRDAPQWEAVAPEVERVLAGRLTLAQNARFENAWLTHHMGADHFDAERGLVDTLIMARHNFALKNHKLETICGYLGVAYTHGHRAMHDAEVTIAAFFAMRRRLQDEYRAKNYGLPQPA